MNVRFSQLLVAIVLALLAVALYRTVNAYQETAVAAALRSRGMHIAERETQRLGERIASTESIASETAMEGFKPAAFARQARIAEAHDAALIAIDFFDPNDVHVAHIEAGGQARLGAPKSRNARTSPAVVEAIEQALFDAELSRSTSLSDIPPKASASPNSPGEYAKIFLATRVVRRGRDLGSVVVYLDAHRLIINDLARISLDQFALDDGRGRLLQAPSMNAVANQPDGQTFPIPVADRVMQLTLVPVVHRFEVKPWWFVLGWLALVFAVTLPIEAVGHINRQVKALNEQLESRVAARTRQLEETLAESRRLADVVESVHEGVMRVDSDGIVRYVNAALCKELGCKAEDLVGQPVTKTAVLGLNAQQLNDLRKTVSELGFVYREMERIRGDGTPYVAGVTFTGHSNGVSAGLIAVSRDVTDRRRLVEELLEAKEQLELEMRARSDFVGTASHELRTPVTTLRTLAALLGEKLEPRYGLAPDDAKLLEVLNRETRRLSHLVDDLLKIAKIDAPETTLAQDEIDLRAVVSTEVEEAARFNQQAGPRIDVHLCATPAMVRGDEDALRSIVGNLVGNACKFTPQTGRVDVTVECDDASVRLIVADEGIGIPKSDLPHIFERFYRVRQSGATAPGAGLGLAIVARLVELMHGSVSVASEVGRGTAITVEYPAVAAGAAAPLPQREAS